MALILVETIFINMLDLLVILVLNLLFHIGEVSAADSSPINDEQETNDNEDDIHGEKLNNNSQIGGVVVGQFETKYKCFRKNTH